MNYLMHSFSNIFHTTLITLVLVMLPISAAMAEGQSEPTGDAMALDVEAVVSAIDLQTREVSLTVGVVFTFAMYVPESLNLETIDVGDQVTGTYFAAKVTDLRKPTSEEVEDPWKVTEAGELADDGGELSAEAARTVRAVVTVLIVDKANERIAVKDSRGMTHFLTEVERDKLTNLKEGQQVVVVFTQATAVTLDKKS